MCFAGDQFKEVFIQRLNKIQVQYKIIHKQKFNLVEFITDSVTCWTKNVHGKKTTKTKNNNNDNNNNNNNINNNSNNNNGYNNNNNNNNNKMF